MLVLVSPYVHDSVVLRTLPSGHITADKMEIKDFPKLPSTISFIRKTLSEIIADNPRRWKNA
ncbi:MAG: hypothetical protein QMD82_03535 [bacterium]|nr:hypothetical protein [bacterium]